MIFYFSIWIFFALRAIQETKIGNIFKKDTQIFLFIFLSFIIGLRNEVGCDWDTYIEIFNYVSRYPNNFGLFERLEPSFYALNVLFSYSYLGYYLINFVIGSIFSFCLIKFCSNLSRPWLALTIALPYFIVVVAMGYTRQSVAIAISIISFLFLEKGKFYKSVFIILLGATFHRSALFFLFAPLVNIGKDKENKVFIRFLISLPIAYYFIDNFILRFIPILRIGYLDNTLMTSSGALVRVLLCIIPSIIFLFNSKKFQFSNSFKRIITTMSLLSILSLILLLTGVSSTAIDRITLNLIPIQFIIGSYLPDIGIFNLSKFVLKMSYIFISFSSLLVFLNYGIHARCWLPYQNIVF